MATFLPTQVCILLMVLNLISGQYDEPTLETSKQWKLMSYNFPSNAPIRNPQFYNPENVLMTGLAVGNDRIFVATPQLFSGVPATVSSIPKTGIRDGTVLEVFPNWSFAVGGGGDFNCSDLKLVSVYRLRIDSCNRLWALDAGISRSLEDFEVTCPPKILVFDLNTNRLVRRIDFPRDVRRGESLFTNLIIDETTSRKGDCNDVFVYISDSVEPGIVVYDSMREVTWRVSHPAMFPDPDFAQSEIRGDKFILMDGVIGLTFDQRSGIVYFQPLATDRVFSITREALRAGPLQMNQILPVKLVGKKSSQGVALALSPKDNSLLFSPLTETAIASYNPATGRQSVLVTDEQRLQFVADIVTSRSDPGTIFILSSKFQRFFLKKLDRNEYNNRILRIDLVPYGNVPVPYSPWGTNTLYNNPSIFAASDRHLSKLPANIPSQLLGYPLNILQRSVKNVFTPLNEDEALPTRLNRRPPDRSFLENLPSTGQLYNRLF